MAKHTTTTLARSAAVAALALVLAGGAALGAVRVGTDQGETLTGTRGADQLTGKGGVDALKGLAGDDTYYFADGWGVDTLEEKARYKVGGKRLPGGVDTLGFATTTDQLTVKLNPEWGAVDSSYNAAQMGANRVDLGQSVVENVTGGQGSDLIVGGAARNTLRPGSGVTDYLLDVGGHTASGPFPALPASDDVYAGVAGQGGLVMISDWGGGADVLDLRPLTSGEVYLDRFDMDDDAQHTKESLQIVTSPTTAVYVLGHFGDYYDNTTETGQQGRIEKLLFADATVGGANALSGATGAAARTGKVAELADAAEGLAAEARTELRKHPLPPAPGAGAAPRGEAAPDRGGAADRAADDEPTDRAEDRPRRR